MCAPGRFGREGACFDCPADHVQPAHGKTSCVRCANVNDTPSAQRRACVPRFTNCAAGSHVVLSSIVPGLRQWLRCPPGRFSRRANSAVCERCGHRDYQPLSGETKCLRCPQGQHHNPHHTKCEATAAPPQCEPGEFAHRSCHLTGGLPCTHAATCLPCPAGKFSSSRGALRCTECPGNTFNADSKATRCETCPAGKFSLTSGAAQCDVS